MPAIILGDYCVAGGNNLVMFPRSGKEPSVPRRCARTAAAAGLREVLAPSAPGDSRLPVTAASRWPSAPGDPQLPVTASSRCPTTPENGAPRSAAAAGMLSTPAMLPAAAGRSGHSAGKNHAWLSRCPPVGAWARSPKASFTYRIYRRRHVPPGRPRGAARSPAASPPPVAVGGTWGLPGSSGGPGSGLCLAPAPGSGPGLRRGSSPEQVPVAGGEWSREPCAVRKQNLRFGLVLFNIILFLFLLP